MIRLPLVAALALVSSFFLTACSDGPSAPEASAGLALPAWQLAEAPADAVGVAELKASASEGDRVTLVGRVGGRMEPVSEESGLVVLVDAAVPSCADSADDNCPTPWDYCCETPERVAANAATVQLRSADGSPIELAAGAVPPLSTVTVVGTVAPRPNGDVLVLVADAMHVAPR